MFLTLFLLSVFTVVLDAPSRSEPSHKLWLHWMSINNSGDLNVKGSGQDIVEYVGAGPPQNSGTV